MSPVKFKIVYSDSYEVDIGAHVFATSKFRLIYERLLQEKLIPQQNFIPAPRASDEELLLVHTQSYLDKLTKGTLSSQELLTLELPYSPALVEASRICVGGTILAAKLALQDGISIHLGGGFHHAFPDHGEGFCLFNDVACAVKYCSQRKNIARMMIVDCDLHQGNGNAFIFRDAQDVFTFSIHQENNYPTIKPASNLDIGLADASGDQEYLAALEENLPRLIQEFKPELIFYIAGADPYRKDQLGGLKLTIEGLMQRDELVFNLAQQKRIKVAVVLGGGYALEIKDTVVIHYHTVKKAVEVFG